MAVCCECVYGWQLCALVVPTTVHSDAFDSVRSDFNLFHPDRQIAQSFPSHVHISPTARHTLQPCTAPSAPLHPRVIRRGTAWTGGGNVGCKRVTASFDGRYGAVMSRGQRRRRRQTVTGPARRHFVRHCDGDSPGRNAAAPLDVATNTTLYVTVGPSIVVIVHLSYGSTTPSFPLPHAGRRRRQRAEPKLGAAMTRNLCAALCA